MKLPSSRWLREIHISTRRWEVLMAVVGTVVIVVAVVWIPSESGSPLAISRIGEIVGEALLAAAIVSFVFGQSANRETVAIVDDAVVRALTESLAPVADAVYEGALASYRWDTILDSAPEDDPYPDYLIQVTTIGYRLAEIPRQVRLLCAASQTDGVLEPYLRDDRYIFRWEVDDNLDVERDSVFEVSYVWLDGEQVEMSGSRTFDVAGGIARECEFDLPEASSRAGVHHIQFQVMVRKYAGDDTRIRIQTHAFKELTDAEFRLSVSSDMEVTQVIPHTGGIQAMAPASPEVTSFELGRGSSRVAIIRIAQPIRAGSNFAFTLVR